MSFHSSLMQLDVFMGDMCNLKCTSCPCWMIDRPPTWDDAALSDRFAELVEYVETNCASFDRLMVIGGEPFLHGGVLDFFQHQDSTVCLSAYTNMTWGSDGDLTFSDNVRFFTSLDAHTEELYRKIRRGRTFDLVKTNLERFSDHIVHVDTTVSKLNLPHLADLFAMTEAIGCTHHFMPMDSRVSFFADQIQNGYRPASERENLLAVRTSGQLERILLETDDLPVVAEFYDETSSPRLNAFSDFQRLYRAGVSHYAGDEDATPAETAFVQQANTDSRCQTLKHYMEITFSRSGNFVPFVHCPTLRRKLNATEGPEFASFEALMEWEEEVRGSVTCSDSCSRTPYLKVDALRVWGANSAKLGRKETLTA